MKRGCSRRKSGVLILPGACWSVVFGFLHPRHILKTCRSVCLSWSKLGAAWTSLILDSEVLLRPFLAACQLSQLRSLTMDEDPLFSILPKMQDGEPYEQLAVIQNLSIRLRSGRAPYLSCFFWDHFPALLTCSIACEKRTDITAELSPRIKLQSVCLRLVCLCSNGDGVLYAAGLVNGPELHQLELEACELEQDYLDQLCSCAALKALSWTEVLLSQLRDFMDSCRRRGRKQWEQLCFKTRAVCDDENFVHEVASWLSEDSGRFSKTLQKLHLKLPVTSSLLQALPEDFLTDLTLGYLPDECNIWNALGSLSRLMILNLEFPEDLCEPERSGSTGLVNRLPFRFPAATGELSEGGNHLITALASNQQLRNLHLVAIPRLEAQDLMRVCPQLTRLQKLTFLPSRGVTVSPSQEQALHKKLCNIQVFIKHFL
jgi:hypothetical protein